MAIRKLSAYERALALRTSRRGTSYKRSHECRLCSPPRFYRFPSSGMLLDRPRRSSVSPSPTTQRQRETSCIYSLRLPELLKTNLWKNGIGTVEELVQLNRYEVLDLFGVGRTSLGRIEAALDARGLALAG